MNSKQNRQFRLAARPAGLPKRSDWELTAAPVAEPGEGEVLVQVLYLSLDPAMRGWMNEGKSYIRPVQIGEVMRAGGVGRVAHSRDDKFAPGDYVTGTTGVQEYAVLRGAELRKVDPRLAPLPVYLGALGMPGMTAYFGLLDVAQVKAGQTVVVSGAAGFLNRSRRRLAAWIAQPASERVSYTSSPQYCRRSLIQSRLYGSSPEP